MKVREICERPVITADAEDSLDEIAGRMDFYAIGALPVYDGIRMVGIITERDIVRAIAAAERLATTPAREYMTPGAATTFTDEDITFAAGTMALFGVRHLPVLEKGRVVGMLSARDLVAALAGQLVTVG